MAKPVVDIAFCLSNCYNTLWFSMTMRGERLMSEDSKETQAPSRNKSHPWLSQLTESEEDDSVDEVIRYTLDELRLA